MIKCEKSPLKRPYEMCAIHALGGMQLDYDLSSPPRPNVHNTTESLAWEITFDIFGGHDGFMDDPRVTLDDMAQKRLAITVEESVPARTLRILGAELRAREEKPFSPVQMSFKEKALFFFGFAPDPDELCGHTIYVQGHWDSDGRVGTFGWWVRDRWHDQTVWLVIIIVSSVIGGLAVLYGSYRVLRYMAARPAKQSWTSEPALGEEREGLLGDDKEEEEEAESRTGSSDVLRNKALPDKPLPDLPVV